jgi:hypothetical protein
VAQQVSNQASGPLWKPEKRAPKPKRPIRQLGKIGKLRLKDKREKLKAEPANHQGYRVCYLCHGWFKYVDLEHVEDASTSPELRHVKSNHKWACRPCNSKKKQKII